jgi:hypothetical protein
MPTSSERYEAAERIARGTQSLQELYGKVHRALVDGRPGDAVPVCDQIVTESDGLGEAFGTPLFPICAACEGYAEVPSPYEADRKVRCQDVPSVCRGNRYGRMHPIQLREYVTMVANEKTPVPVDEPTEETQPETQPETETEPETEPETQPETQP